MRRAVWNEVGQIARDAQDYPGTADEMLAAIQQRLFDISLRRTQLEVMPFHQVASLVADDIDRRSRSHRAAGMPTGFVDLDKLLGGMQAGETIVVGARTSVGKTSFAANIAYNVAANPVAAERVPVLFISHEQDAVEIGKKLICMHAEVSGIRVRAGKIESDEVDKLASAIRALSDIPLWINKTEVSNIEQIQSIAKAWKVKHNIGLLVIDYLQLTRTETSHRTIYETVTAVSRQAKQLARSLQIPVILPAQLNREVEAKANKEPTLATLRDSGGIEQDADIVLLLWQPDDATTGQTDRIIKVKIAKQRNGPLGTATLFFRGQTQRFENYEPQAPREWTR
jgi:replicative DNA helicase